MVQTLSRNERLLIARLNNVSERTLIGLAFKTAAKKAIDNNDLAGFKALIYQLKSQWNDCPRGMFQALGFNLNQILTMKFYTVEQLNNLLADAGFIYRVIEESTTIGTGADWVAKSGYAILKDGIMNVYTDSNLNRFVKLGNGQIFACSNTDLVSMNDYDQQIIKAYLTGLID